MTVSSRLVRIAAAASIAGAAVGASAPAHAGSEPFLGELMLTGYNFCPRGFATASGQILSIAQNTALFALLGTTFGGNGQSTFALPDLRGRAPVGQGQGPGLSNYILGQTGGQESFTLTTAQMPAHNHVVNVTNAIADKAGPGDKLLASGANNLNLYSESAPNRTMNSAMIGTTGSGQPVGHRGPYLTMTWCIALQGIFPPRD